MRSRLEARVAAELDTFPDAPSWSYEPRAFANEEGQYLPDFQVDGMPQVWYIEVKPTLEAAYRVLPRMQIIWDSEPAAWLSVIVPKTDDTRHYVMLTAYGDRYDRKWHVF